MSHLQLSWPLAEHAHCSSMRMLPKTVYRASLPGPGAAGPGLYFHGGGLPGVGSASGAGLSGHTFHPVYAD